MKPQYFLLILLLGLFLAACENEPEATHTVILPQEQSMAFTYIPPGNFLMGSESIELARHNDEGPVRRVHLTKGFYLGTYEVTQAQWESVMGSNPSIFKTFPDASQHPVDMISWNDAQHFIDKLNTLGVGKFRLPTEAEWEYACRAGSNTRYYWGTDSTDWKVYKHAWAFSRSEGRSHPVGQKQPNAWGLYDMSGNVWEWCSDWRSKRYDPADTLNPRGAASGTKKIYRGGSWFNKLATLRSANRNGHEPDVVGSNSGLRVLLEIE